ncbi:MAG: NADH:ubiquinone reductase (Na(+)-transporting) subunit C [Rikenellaceae bacterium]|nr:NADH:ubiquinone reductase (Na(+)-transporting) subunit C [Rikenellaceae bacterium]
MNKNSNAYIITYSTVMVVVVAAVLAFASLSLQKKQNENVRIEKMNDILQSIGQGMDADKAPDKAKYVTGEYDKYIIESFAVNTAGERVAGADAFALLINLKAEYEKPEADRVLPVFVSKDDNGDVHYILPVWGSGLWGPIWGYIALKSDWDTVYGVVFGHKGETPGLGAEITTLGFTGQFKDKQIFQDAEIVAISVLKGTGASAGNIHAVDAISGGTITSRGVEAMLKNCLADYSAYIKKERSAEASAVPAAELVPADSITVMINE